jgi:hypothetical protein
MWLWISLAVGYLALLAGVLTFLYAAATVSEDPEQDRWVEEHRDWRYWDKAA